MKLVLGFVANWRLGAEGSAILDRQHAKSRRHGLRRPRAGHGGILGRLSWRARRLGGHLAGRDDGVSAVEFAFVLPILLVLLTGMINVGMLFLAQNNMMRVAQNAARNLSMAQMNETETEAYIKDQLSKFAGSLVVDVILPNTAATPPETDVTVTISIPVVDVMPIDIVGLRNVEVFQSGALRTQITMRQEVTQ